MENQPMPNQREKALPESSYSEVDQAKIIEGTTIDTKQIKKRKPIATVSRESKIIEAYKQTQTQIIDLLRVLSESSDNLRYQEKVLEEIKGVRVLQDELLQCLLLEQRGELSQATTSKQAWNLIE